MILDDICFDISITIFNKLSLVDKVSMFHSLTAPNIEIKKAMYASMEGLVNFITGFSRLKIEYRPFTHINADQVMEVILKCVLPDNVKYSSQYDYFEMSMLVDMIKLYLDRRGGRGHMQALMLAYLGEFEIIYEREEELYKFSETCAYMAGGGNLAALTSAITTGYTCDCSAYNMAMINGHFEIVRWLYHTAQIRLNTFGEKARELIGKDYILMWNFSWRCDSGIFVRHGDTKTLSKLYNSGCVFNAKAFSNISKTHNSAYYQHLKMHNKDQLSNGRESKGDLWKHILLNQNKLIKRVIFVRLDSAEYVDEFRVLNYMMDLLMKSSRWDLSA